MRRLTVCIKVTCSALVLNAAVPRTWSKYVSPGPSSCWRLPQPALPPAKITRRPPNIARKWFGSLPCTTRTCRNSWQVYDKIPWLYITLSTITRITALVERWYNLTTGWYCKNEFCTKQSPWSFTTRYLTSWKSAASVSPYHSSPVAFWSLVGFWTVTRPTLPAAYHMSVRSVEWHHTP